MKKISLFFIIVLICGAALLAGCTQQPPGPPQTTTPAPTPASTPVPDTVRVATSPQYGSILVDSGGKTLYYFTKDIPGNGTSACYNQCVVIWPVFRAEQLRVSPPLNSADFGEITRTTGEKQTTFKGWPLYYYQGDTAPGETKGYGINQAWYLLSPTGIITPVPTTPATVATTQQTTQATARPTTERTPSSSYY
jgi:predicted lipoprotein with Yx(FWY)xxD motif